MKGAVLASRPVDKNALSMERLREPRYFIERFFSIIDKERKKTPFFFKPAQVKYYENRTRHDLILKARKEGFSSLIEALFLHACIFEDNVNAVTMAHTWDDTTIHLDRVKYFLETLGVSNLKFEVALDKENQREIFFPHSNSRYWIGTAGSKAFGRGRDITHLHLSEVAHYENQEVLTSALEACVPNAWKVLETTANGLERFYELWTEAGDRQSQSPWKQHFFAWFEAPESRIPKPTDKPLIFTPEERRMKDRYHLDDEQVLWYRMKRAEMADKAMMPQEHPCEAEEAFIHSGRPAFNQEKLSLKLSVAKTKQPYYQGELVNDGREVKLIQNEEGALRIWVMPRQRRSYLIAADVGLGVQGGDYSFAQVLDRASWEQVAVLRIRLNPGEWGRALSDLGYFFNNAVVCPENNSIGQGTIEALKEVQYPHLLKARELWPTGENPQAGFPTTEKYRNLAITALRTAVDEDTIFINDTVTLNEMMTFVQNEDTGKFEAQEGRFDDGVMSLAIGAYCLKFLTVDESYSDHAHQKKNPFIPNLEFTGEGNKRRRSATGYR